MARSILTTHTALASLFLCGLLAHSDSHATHTLKFNVQGEIVADCGFEPQAVVFDLGNVDISELPSVGSTSSWVDGALLSTGCAGVSSIKLALVGAADATNANLFAAAGGSRGIAIEFATDDGRSVVPNGPALPWTPKQAGDGYGYRARYVRTLADVKVGPATATITVNLEHD